MTTTQTPHLFPARSSKWVSGNHFELLENGETFFPRVFDAIRQAKTEVMLETYILFDDKIGKELHQVLLEAAQRGVHVHVLVDGFGSPDLDEYVKDLVAAGVNFRIFDPGQKLFGHHLNLLRRMHRKIVVVDGVQGFIGGINYSADHVADYGPEAKQDYAVAVKGPIVADMHRHTRKAVLTRKERAAAESRLAVISSPEEGAANAIFVTRDNRHHAHDIERHYRIALRSAKKSVVIANAYFFPGYRFIRELRRAAKRGVEVRLILQGHPDMPIVKVAAQLLYDHLLRSGVHIYEYCTRPLHGKVAVVDDEWSTVGSSNLDPLSLGLNLEANVIIRDRAFNAELAQRLDHLMESACTKVEPTPKGPWDSLRLLRGYAVFQLVRWFPALAGFLPIHHPSISLVMRK